MNDRYIISKQHTDSPTGYAYVNVLDENTFAYTTNILDATVFTSHETACEFRDDWDLGGFHTVDSV